MIFRRNRHQYKISFRKKEGCFISLNLFFNIDQETLNGKIREFKINTKSLNF